MRIIIKDLFKYIDEPGYSIKRDNVLIYGAGNHSILVKRALETQKGLLINVQGFIDTGLDKLYKYIEQTQVYPVKSIQNLKQKFSISTMFITAEDLNTDSKRNAVEKCIEYGIKVITVAPSNQWLNGMPTSHQFKDLKIEDLLERAPIELCKEHICSEVKGKRILVTGAAGSIGAEIVRQIMGYNPEFVVLCDRAETPLHDIQLELEDGIYAHKSRIFVSDIQNSNRIKTLFNLYKPQIVFHAAAYKHVPMMENHPTEAVLTNIWGTKNLADISVDHGVEKFIMISTDKAVRPTNVMGASKRIAEMYIQALNNSVIYNQLNYTQSIDSLRCKTKFITTRFGNVLGSNGSVIPRFKAQIERGGPITVTHPDITRYFMTIPEAVHLVLEASVMGNGGEIFIFDMGKPVKITDLAVNMIKLAGFVPDVDIKILFTGLRPGEKLYEELLNDDETVIPTYNKDIKISKTIPNCYVEINNVIKELLDINLLNNVDGMVGKMKAILPDFISNNSQYQKLDKNSIPAEIV
ncbi:nucleoside-diphosphate sugar epimerase/dehydratase [Mucilaginibacter sp.]|uniref:polysaccharide biosynthesis protein n=1 Tax=Mucilaginibacter sp. TaxID=1882438 RepID=UPI00261D6B89|nr:nucleoside-diphosphate sugar epimerase/dehydratase [Mucilaginibacter sp.]